LWHFASILQCTEIRARSGTAGIAVLKHSWLVRGTPAGASARERLLMAGNQLGKTLAGLDFGWDHPTAAAKLA
jgi:hypothetical protein